MQQHWKMKMHRPKGSMCAECEHLHDDCSALPFRKMQAIGKDRDGTVVVRCTEYAKRKQPNAPLQPHAQRVGCKRLLGALYVRPDRLLICG